MPGRLGIRTEESFNAEHCKRAKVGFIGLCEWFAKEGCGGKGCSAAAAMIIRLLADPHESNGKRHAEPRAFDTLSCKEQNQFSSATSQFAAPLDLFATP